MAKGRAGSVVEDLSNVEFETSEGVEVIDKFKNMGLREELMRGIFAYGKLIIAAEQLKCMFQLLRVIHA